MNGSAPAGPGQHPTVPYGQPVVVQQPTHTGYDPRVGHRTDGYRGYDINSLPPTQQNGGGTLPGQNGGGQQPVMGYAPQQPQQHPQAQGQQTPQPQYPGGYQPYGQYPGQSPQQQQQGGYPGGYQQQRQPQGYPQQQAPQQQGYQGNIIQMSDDTVLDGPGVPPELRGRRWGNVRQAYTQMMADTIRGRQQQQPRQQQPQGGYQQQGGYPQPQGQQQPGQQQNQQVNERAFYERPISTMQETLRNIVREELAPVQERSRQESVREVESRIAQSIPDYQQLAPLVHQRLGPLAQSNPDALASENIWRDAVRLVRGELMERGQYQQPQQGYGQQQQTQPVGSMYGGQYSGGYGGYQQPQRPTPMGGHQMPVSSFFTEGPTPPPMNPQGTLSPTEQWYAERMGMQPAEYMAWKNGVQGGGLGGQPQQFQQQNYGGF